MVDCYRYRADKARATQEAIRRSDERSADILRQIEEEVAEFERTGVDPYHIPGIHVGT